MKHTQESKRKCKEARLKWLKENPDKHPWRNRDKFKSAPCEKVKEFLRKLGIKFIEEFQPCIENRNFSLDIALPDKMIALEINGNQHYERNGKLKPYYAERQMLLEKAGWIVYQIHYSACFNLEKWSDFVKIIQSSSIKVDFDYFNYVPKQKVNLRLFCECGGKKNVVSKKCRSCNDKEPRPTRVKWPTKEELAKLVWEIPTSILTKKLGLSSDSNIDKRCKKYGISKPPRGYWAKRQVGMSHEEALNKMVLQTRIPLA